VALGIAWPVCDGSALARPESDGPDGAVPDSGAAIGPAGGAPVVWAPCAGAAAANVGSGRTPDVDTGSTGGATADRLGPPAGEPDRLVSGSTP
jgi:hypothetical protein